MFESILPALIKAAFFIFLAIIFFFVRSKLIKGKVNDYSLNKFYPQFDTVLIIVYLVILTIVSNLIS